MSLDGGFFLHDGHGIASSLQQDRKVYLSQLNVLVFSL